MKMTVADWTASHHGCRYLSKRHIESQLTEDLSSVTAVAACHNQLPTPLTEAVIK